MSRRVTWGGWNIINKYHKGGGRGSKIKQKVIWLPQNEGTISKKYLSGTFSALVCVLKYIISICIYWKLSRDSIVFIINQYIVIDWCSIWYYFCYLLYCIAYKYLFSIANVIFQYLSILNNIEKYWYWLNLQ